MIGWWLALQLAHGAILVEGEPSVGEPLTVVVVDDISRPVPGAPVRLLVRPGLTGARDLDLGLTDGQGTLRWTPEEPGTYALAVGDDERHVAVPWPAPSPAAAVLLGALGLLGLGALVAGFRRRPR